jgi:hypothetical protein
MVIRPEKVVGLTIKRRPTKTPVRSLPAVYDSNVIMCE